MNDLLSCYLINRLSRITIILFSFVATGEVFASEKKTASQDTAGPDVYWSYSGELGPANWGELSAAYELCATGHQQSPIDLTRTQGAGLVDIETDYRAQPLHVVNNGHTIQVNYDKGSSMVVGHSKYELLQFHFHSPSENQVNGKSYPMEIHFVHKDQHGTFGVLGVFVEVGDENIALREIWSRLPKKGGEAFQSREIVINGNDLLPRERDYYRFVGSLTTPPCSEGVQWHLMHEPIQASTQQIAAFLEIIGENARPVQGLGHRLVMDSSYTRTHGTTSAVASAH